MLPTGLIPFMGYATATLMIILFGGLLFGMREAWLPAFLRRRTIGRERIEREVQRIRPWANRVDSISKPRLGARAAPPFFAMNSDRSVTTIVFSRPGLGPARRTVGRAQTGRSAPVPIGPAAETTNVVGRALSGVMVRGTPSARGPQDGSSLARATLRARFARRHACPRARPRPGSRCLCTRNPTHHLGHGQRALLETGTAEVDAWASFVDAEEGKAIFSVSGGLLLFDVSDGAHPTAQAYYPIDSWYVPELTIDGGEIVFAAGPYGIYRFDTDAYNLRTR